MDNTIRIDPFFGLASDTRLEFGSGQTDQAALEFCTHAVARNTAELQRHIQRINLYLARPDKNGLFGALLDLYIALGAKGRQLRERMLKVAKPHLDNHQFHFLLTHLEAGVSDMEPAPPAKTSVLTKGISGTTTLVEKLSGNTPNERDPIIEAREHLEYGQVAEAQAVLESAILTKPDRPDIYEELADIYRHMNDSFAFHSMNTKLIDTGTSTPEAWNALAAYFEGTANDHP